MRTKLSSIFIFTTGLTLIVIGYNAIPNAEAQVQLNGISVQIPPNWTESEMYPPELLTMTSPNNLASITISVNPTTRSVNYDTANRINYIQLQIPDVIYQSIGQSPRSYDLYFDNTYYFWHDHGQVIRSVPILIIYTFTAEGEDAYNAYHGSLKQVINSLTIEDPDILLQTLQ